MSCIECKYWQPNMLNKEKHTPEDTPEGAYCLRFPPPMAVMTPSSGLVGQKPQVNYTWSFPTVGKSLICGEFYRDDRFVM